MPGTFLSPLAVEIGRMGGARPARLLRPLVYLTGDGQRVTAPAGFATDLASIPWWARWAFGRIEHDTDSAAVIHDWLYVTHQTSRAGSDLIFHDALRVAGAGPVKAWLMWAGVRLGGRAGWRHDHDPSMAAQLATPPGAEMIQLRHADLKAFYPRAKAGWLDSLALLGPLLADHYKFNRLDWVHFAGQMGAETDGLALVPMRENMHFTTPARIVKVYSYRLGVAIKRDEGIRRQYRDVWTLARGCVRNATFLADVVYGGREGTPWMQGSRYIGRGPTQITHLNNYAAIRDEIRRQPGGDTCPDLVDAPEALEQPEWGVRAAFADWHIKGMATWARRDAVDNVSALLNTGSPSKISITNGLTRRRRWVAQAKARWPVDLPAWVDETIADATIASRAAEDGGRPLLRHGARGDDVMELQRRLAAAGYYTGVVDDIFGTMTRRAVVALQIEHGLETDGIVGPRTWDVLETTDREPLETRQEATPAIAAAAGDVGAQAGQTAAKAGQTVAALGLTEAAVDQATGVSLWDAAIGAVGKLGELVGQVTATGVTISPKIAGALLVCALGVAMWQWGRSAASRALQIWKSGGVT